LKLIFSCIIVALLFTSPFSNTREPQSDDYIYYSSEGFSNGSQGRDIIRMNPDGGSKTKLTNNNGGNHYPHHINPKLSPDGNKIVYQSDTDRHDKYAIWVMNSDGTNKKRITEKEGMYPNWSADGKQIIFSGRRNGIWEIILIPSAGGEEINLSKNFKNNKRPGWGATCTFHPNGKTLVYSYIREKVLYSMDLNTKQVTVLTNPKYKYIHPIFSKDGSTITANRKIDNSGYDLVTMNLNGTNEQIVAKNVVSYSSPAWSENGNELVFSGVINGNQQIFRINIKTKKETTLTNKPFFNAMPTW